MAEPSPTTSVPAPLRSAMKSDGDGDRTPPASGTLKGMHIFFGYFKGHWIAA
jgi:hypothetical protein